MIGIAGIVANGCACTLIKVVQSYCVPVTGKIIFRDSVTCIGIAQRGANPQLINIAGKLTLRPVEGVFLPAKTDKTVISTGIAIRGNMDITGRAAGLYRFPGSIHINGNITR